MAGVRDELQRLKINLEQLADAQARHGAVVAKTSAPPSMVVQVYQQVRIPISTDLYFACHPCAVLGPEIEGDGGALTPNAATTIYVYVLGSQAPVAGDYLIARFVGSRWVAERMAKHKPTPVVIPGCPCKQIPTTLAMSSLDPSKNGGYYPNDTIIWQPRPSWITAGAGADPGFYGTTTFSDATDGTPWVYYFWCYQASYMLSRAGKNGVGQTNQIQFVINGRSNACIPDDNFPGYPAGGYTFAMTSGTIFGLHTVFDNTQGWKVVA